MQDSLPGMQTNPTAPRRPRRGRPPIDPAIARSQIVKVALTGTEKNQLQALADAEGISLSTYVRERLLANARPPLAKVS